MASYERDYELWGIALPDELFGMFDTGSVLRGVRRYGIAILLIIALGIVVWAVRYDRAERERTERYAPVSKAQAEVSFLEDHHGTEEEVCAARQALVKAENEARVGDGNDLDHLSARLCAENLELAARLKTAAD
jgi:hypothetical protein